VGTRQADWGLIMAARESKWSGVFGGGGGGGMSGPGSSTDGALSEFNGTSGELLRESTARIESDDLSLAGQLVKFNRDGTDGTAEGSGLRALGNAGATLAELLYDSTLASKWKAGPNGSLYAVLTAGATQTVQNKTLDNTNSIDVPDDQLRIEDTADPTKKIRFAAGAVTAGQTRVISAIDEDLELLGRTNTQTVTNKTHQDSIFDGGSASSARKIILPKGTKTALDALTQEEGLLTYATDEDRGYLSNGTAQIKIGTVDGPASATDNQLARFDGTTGKMIQDSAIGVNDSGDMAGIRDLDMTGDLLVGGNAVITGNLEVQGTETTLNTDELQVEDPTIQVNFGGTDASAEGSGIEALGTGNVALARLQYDSALASKWKAGAAGSEKEILTAGDTQAVSSKTLNNTNSAALKDDQFTLEDPADSTKKLRFDAGNVTPGQTRVMAVPNADTTLLGTDTSQTVTNKLHQDSIFDGGTASTARRINLPKDTYANLSALPRSEGAVYYATDQDLVYYDDGSNLFPIGSGGSDGGLNLLVNPLDGWVASGAGVAVGVTTTASDLPLPGIGASGIKIDFVSGSDYARRRFQTVDAVLSTVLAISWYQKTLNSYADGQAKLELYVNSDTTPGSYTGSYTEVSLLSDVSGDTLIPAVTRKLPLGTPYNFTSDGTLKNYELRIVRVSGTGSIVIQRPSVGMPAVQQVPTIGKWEPCVFTHNWGANATVTARRRQVGQNMEYDLNLTLSGAPSTADLLLTLPSDDVMDTSILSGSAAYVTVLGSARIYDSGAMTYAGNVVYSTSTIVRIGAESGGANLGIVNQAYPFTFGASDSINTKFSVPLTRLATSASLNALSQNTQSPIKAGTIMPFAGAVAPTGWLLGDGSVYLKTQYPQLYASIGDTWATCTNPLTGSAYSAPASDSFRVPDLRGVFLRGEGTFSDGIGTDTTLAGYQADQIQGHYHSTPIQFSSVNDAGSNFPLLNQGTAEISGSVTGPITDGTNGTPRTGKETRPRNVGVKYIIKAWDESFNLAGFGLATQTASGLVSNQVAPTSLTASDFASQTNCTIDSGDVPSGACKWAMVNGVVTLWLYVDTFTITPGSSSFTFVLPSSIPAPTNTVAASMLIYDNSGSTFVLADVRIFTNKQIAFSKSGGSWTGGTNTNYIRGQISWFTT
jgi:hypothetical protein